MIITPKPKSFETRHDKNVTPDTARRGNPQADGRSESLLLPARADAKEEKTRASSLQINPESLISSARQTKINELNDMFGDHNAVQIKGISKQKTAFSRQELANIKQEFFRAKYPLILVRQGTKDGSVARFLHGPEQLKSLGSNFSKALDGQEVTIFMGVESVSLAVPRRLLQDNISGSDALEAILGSGDVTAYEEQPGANKCFLAALLQSGVLDVIKTNISELLRDSVPENIRASALTCALYNCIGSGLPEIGQVLLSWGANPNGVRPSDDFGMLQHAVVSKDVPLIKLLLEHGADPTKETESCISALDYAESPDFSDMKPYLIKSGSDTLKE